MNPALILRALASARRPATGSARTLQLQGPLSAESSRLAAYGRWLGIPVDPIPTPFLFVMVQPPHLDALLRAGAPVLGAVHLEADLRRGPGAPTALDAATTLEEGEPLAGRRTLWLRTDLRENGAPWGHVAARYALRPPPGAAKPPRHHEPPTPLPDDLPHHLRPIPWGAGAGRAYARVSGDYNPIHLAATTARWFGQKAAILHGMAIAASAWKELGARDHLHVLFRKPLILPGSTALLHDGRRFQVRTGDGTVRLAEGEVGG